MSDFTAGYFVGAIFAWLICAAVGLHSIRRT